MGSTVARSKVFAVTVEVSDERLKKFKRAPEAVQDALDVAAEYWRTGILPKHFERGAGAKYGYATRSLAYIKKNQGNPSLVRTGQMKADLMARAQIRMSGRTLEVKMSARALNLAPQMADSNQDDYVKHSNKNARGFPNMKKEIRAFTDEEREQLGAIIEAELIRAFGPVGD